MDTISTIINTFNDSIVSLTKDTLVVQVNDIVEINNTSNIAIYIMEHLLSTFVGILFCSATAFVLSYRNKKKFIKRTKKKISKYNKHVFEKIPEYTPLIENTKWNEHTLTVTVNARGFIIPIPDDKITQLEEANFKEVKCEEEDQNIYQNLIDHIRLVYGDTIYYNKEFYSIPEFVNLMAQQTADKFLSEIKQHRVRFNKDLFGVYSLEEKNGLNTIVLYDSNYFTFKTMQHLYNTLKRLRLDEKYKFVRPVKENPKINFPDEIPQYYPKAYDKIFVLPLDPNKEVNVCKIYPFLNSIGIGGFIIMDRGYGDELVWGYRGTNNASGGYWHFTYDETFTKDDCDVEKTPLIENCLRRALTEEVGLFINDQKKIIPKSQIGFVNAGIIKTGRGDDRFEFEVCSYVRVCLSEQYTFDDFLRAYRFAKDAELETQCLDFVLISELNDFLRKNKVSPESKALSLRLKYLLENKIIKTDLDGYHEIIKDNTTPQHREYV